MNYLVEIVRERLRDRLPASGPPGLRPAAVLIPIVSGPEGPSLLLTRRAETLRRQPGDISFPGGAIDPSDETPLAAALRESREEVGLDSEAITLLGQMDERGTVTGFRITPFVGAVLRPYEFEPNHEVGELLQVPIEALSEPAALFVEKRHFRGLLRDVYHYRYHEHDIWGITGQLVKDFLELIR
ncbi:MAG TPA: CoA pyrophosphatase [Vicinamibacteria bacterium]|nr:CoA pyrophosphatase [Vicinamibacteria bacterium]